MEKLRTQTQYKPANGRLGFPRVVAQKIMNRLSVLVVFGCGSVFLVLALFTLKTVFSAPPDANADDYGQYLSHARNLLEGLPYSEIGFIYTDLNNLIGPVAEPIGFPATLAILASIGELSDVTVKLLMVISLALFAFFILLYLRRINNDTTALIVTGMTTVALLSVYAINTPNSDLGFSAALWATFLAFDTKKPASWLHIVSGTLTGSVAILYRLAAAPLIPSALLLLVIDRSNRRWRLLIPVLVWSCTFVISSILLPSGGAMMNEITQHYWNTLNILKDNFFFYSYSYCEALLYPFANNWMNDIYHGAALLFTFGGLIHWTIGRWRSFAFLFFINYVALILIVPTQSSRYLWPLWPLILFWTILGIQRLLKHFPVSPTAVNAFLIIYTLLLGLMNILHLNTSTRLRPFYTDPQFPIIVDVMRTNCAVEDLSVLTFSPRVFTWNTGIPAMGPFKANSDETLREIERKNIAFILLRRSERQSSVEKSIVGAITKEHSRIMQVEDYSDLLLYRNVDHSCFIKQR